MRFSFLQGFNTSVESMLKLQDQTYKTQNQISTGRRILTPADDPVATAILIQLGQEQSLLKQFVANSDMAENRLRTQEIKIEAVNNLLVDARASTIQAGNGVIGFNERQSIAANLELRLSELVSLANSTNANGEYIFSGFQGDVKPFSENPDGTYSYNGDSGQRTLTIGGGIDIPISDSGRAIFEEIPASEKGFNSSVTNSAGAVISPGTVTNQVTYDANYPTDYVITFTSATTFDVTTEAGAALLSAQPYTSGAAISINGAEVAISGVPANGDTFKIDSSEKQSIMSTLGKLVEGLKSLSDNPADTATRNALIDESLANISAAQTSLAQVWSTVGARMNTLDSIRDLNTGVQIVNEEVTSELRDLDYAEAISRLSIEAFTLEAAQQSFTRVNRLSLFNFL
ncbi:MAG: flagellar hook-associated protein 3 FlgL [Oceanicoccus sp.]|jgi:flagellar hook-associated protein 3 FlgL